HVLSRESAHEDQPERDRAAQVAPEHRQRDHSAPRVRTATKAQLPASSATAHKRKRRGEGAAGSGTGAPSSRSSVTSRCTAQASASSAPSGLASSAWANSPLTKCAKACVLPQKRQGQPVAALSGQAKSESGGASSGSTRAAASSAAA